MKRISKSGEIIVVVFEQDELLQIRSLLLETAFALGSEISARTGINQDEAMTLFDSLDRVLEMKLKKPARKKRSLQTIVR